MKVLIVGWGSIAQRHLSNILSLANDTRVVVLKRSATPIEYSRDIDVVLDIESALALKPDYAIVASPSALHIDVLPALIRAGIPSYVEKPIVTSSNDVSRVTQELLAKPGVNHFAGFNLRLLGSLQKVRRAVQSGRLGNVVRASFSAGQWLPDWRPAQDFRQGYSASPDLGGGVLLDLCHEFDASRWLLGPIHLSFCKVSNAPTLNIAAESVAILGGHADNGALVTFGLDYVARSPVRRYEIIGDEASLTWDLPGKSAVIDTPRGREILTDVATDFSVSDTYPTAMRAFVNPSESVPENTPPTLEDGLASTLVAIKAGELGRH